MSYWVGSAVPVYSTSRGAKRKPVKKKGAAAPPSPSPLAPSPSSSQRTAGAITDLLEPAVDGPPSSASIRAFSKHVRRTSVGDKHQSRQTNSSGSSSVRSRGSVDRPSWEQAFEGLTLSRKSSGRSTSSSMPSRERPDSVQIFGKTLFNRRNRVKRESTAQSSSGSSMYSADHPAPELVPQMSTNGNQAGIPNLFNRRRTMKPEFAEDAAAQKRFQISGPYNFQHVTHTQRDHLPNIQRVSRLTLTSDFTAIRAAQSPSNGTLRGIYADELGSPAYPGEEEDEFLAQMNMPNALYHSQLSLHKQPSPPRRLVKHSRSQEQLRQPPPRPPRSPPLEPPSYTAPLPPPRISSRTSIRYDGYDPLNTTTLERPQTSGGFRQPQPLTLVSEQVFPPATSYGFRREVEADHFQQANRVSQVVNPPDDSNWPLPSAASFESPLPDVPEEEEHHLSRQSRASLASNSSLRGSHSVPLLRQLAQSQSSGTGSQRPISGASDTLGRFDLFSAQRALKASLSGTDEGEALPRASWEDDIDFCYEHAAEADCDFDWDRISMDASHEDDIAHRINLQVVDDEEDGASPAMLTPGRFDLPELSPASQISESVKQEAVTPTAPTVPVSSNFSVPRGDATPPQQRLLNTHGRTASHASSFKESHGFALSPSLLIPGDFRQQMASNDSEEFVDRDEHDQELNNHQLPYDEPTLTMKMQPRMSASTTGSDSERSGFSRHISGTSASTDLTRLTMSTSSLDMESYIPKHDRPESLAFAEEVATAAAAAAAAEHRYTTRSSGKSIMPIVPESEEAPDQPQSQPGAGTANTYSGMIPPGTPDPNTFPVPNLEDSAALGTIKRRDSLRSRRQRSRASSIPPPPPAGQYSMFPSVKVYGTHI